ncbi:conserved hypothetical protein [Flavobacterium sp. 9AF]|uniref:hypothetical protein n=1 Tax=Flavobacterium sp. 9AF TaxID=2653142 RepID=UPI0012F1AA4B|nr:hypothetical protein [Flavobacterium sp. 9AF]VXC33672.1 conserved hypothetical protein [Flavobacterium sp. 9AF]
MKTFTLYLDTLIFEKDTIKGSRNRLSPNLSYTIPDKSIQSITIQDGSKKFLHKDN